MKKSVGVYVNEDVDYALGILAAKLKVKKSDLYELGARVILTLAAEARISDDLARMLERNDPEALERLRVAIKRANAVSVESPF